MCGRYTLVAADPRVLRERFGLGDEVPIVPRFNVAPGDDVLAVTTDRNGVRRGELLRWGLIPPWAKPSEAGAKTINARSETVSERPAYRVAFERFRCLIIADGFYEWRRTPGGAKQPFHITRPDGRPFAFAGLWSIWRGQEQTIRSCTILTTRASDTVAPLHDRMPVILSAEQEGPWLDPGRAGRELLPVLGGPSPVSLALRAVSCAVNDARYDGPDCLAAPAEDVQSTLF